MDSKNRYFERVTILFNNYLAKFNIEFDKNFYIRYILN